jgi:uncharacterized protein (DUF1330 family)
MPAYILVDIKIRDPEIYERYKQLAPPSLAAYGGKYLVRGAPVETLEGDWQPGRFVMVQFPSLERARAWWASSEYAEGKALRQSCSDTGMILVEGL